MALSIFKSNFKKLLGIKSGPVSREEALEIFTAALLELSGADFTQMGPTGKIHLWLRGAEDAESLLPDLMERTGLRNEIVHSLDKHDFSQGPAGDALLSLDWPVRDRKGRVTFEVGWTFGTTSGHGQQYEARPLPAPNDVEGVRWSVHSGQMTWLS